jgi:hypothetical protein
MMDDGVAWMVARSRHSFSLLYLSVMDLACGLYLIAQYPRSLEFLESKTRYPFELPSITMR